MAKAKPIVKAAIKEVGGIQELVINDRIVAQDGESSVFVEAAYLNEAQRRAIKKAHPSWQVFSKATRVGPDQKVDSIISFPITELTQ